MQSLRSLNLEDLLEQPFLEVVKNNTVEIIAEPDESIRITNRILFTVFNRLSEQFNSVPQPGEQPASKIKNN